ncbi:MAG TPA: sulfite exporter TauE/SafE family protein [candidate division Zixibacteria bacterium]|nr:sulfite exporter TauE/SafE family protein [candidate division Zixibacteria bacterium]
METLFIFLGAVAAGLLAGFLGVGGGILIVPALTLFAGTPIKDAVGVSLTSIITVSMSASTVYLNKDLVDLRMGIYLAIAASVGGITGALAGGIIPEHVVALLFGSVMLYAIFSMLRRDNPTQPSHTGYSATRIAIFMFLTFLVGNLTGLLGIGGGLAFIPLMYIGLGFPMALAVGTSAFNVGLAATGGALIYFLRGDLNSALPLIPPVVIGMIVGAKLGGLFGVRAKPIVTKIVFSGMLVYFCYRMIAKGIAGL